jgi:hypothetical protein
MPREDTQFKPGDRGNPGGCPKGKRISTWMAELGDMNPALWPNPSKLPANGLIAMERLKAAMTDEGCRDTQLIADITESKPQPPALSIVIPEQRQAIINKLDGFEKPIAPHANA